MTKPWTLEARSDTRAVFTDERNTLVFQICPEYRAPISATLSIIDKEFPVVTFPLVLNKPLLDIFFSA